jgi:biopolymer transport protein ExbB
MNRRATFLFLASLPIVVPCAARPAVAAEGVNGLAASAQQDLDTSLAELSGLRERIAAERLPLAQELSALEERLAGLRRDVEGATRDGDTARVDLTNLKAEMKLRQEEVTYLGNLLDEYRGGFETRIDASERQRYEPFLHAAANAPANGNLSVGQKLEAQVALVKASVARLDDLIGGARFAGQAIDPQGLVAQGTFALVGPIALFASASAGATGVSMPQTGSTKPAVRPLDPPLTAGIGAIVAEGTGILPLDPTRGGALKALVQKASLIRIFTRGGPIMWPLLFASILALGTALERIVFLLTVRRRRDEHALQQMLDAVESGDVDAALRIGKGSRYFVCDALTYALEHRERSISNALVLAQSLEIKRFTRGIPILDTVITLAPLLGLLGTVTGMMNSFSLIGGDLGAPSAITGGIAEALIATAFGLGIAITSLVPFNYLNSKVDEARHDLDAASTRLELLMLPRRELRAAPAAAAS